MNKVVLVLGWRESAHSEDCYGFWVWILSQCLLMEVLWFSWCTLRLRRINWKWRETYIIHKPSAVLSIWQILLFWFNLPFFLDAESFLLAKDDINVMHNYKIKFHQYSPIQRNIFFWLSLALIDNVTENPIYYYIHWSFSSCVFVLLIMLPLMWFHWWELLKLLNNCTAGKKFIRNWQTQYIIMTQRYVISSLFSNIFSANLIVFRYFCF